MRGFLQMGDSKTGDDEMTTDSKLEPPRESTPSSIESDGEQDDAGAEPSLEQAQPQKRKGGRKPVCSLFAVIKFVNLSLNYFRYTQPLRSASNGIDKRKPHSESGEQST